MISGNRDEAWPMYLAWPIPERFMLGVIRWHVTCMLSFAGHWQDRRALSNHVCAHSVIPMWHVVCLRYLARASSEQSRSTTVLPVSHVIQIPQCLSGFVNHDYSCLVFSNLALWWVWIKQQKYILYEISIIKYLSSLAIFLSKKTSKLRVTGLCREFTGNRWILRTYGQ